MPTIAGRQGHQQQQGCRNIGYTTIKREVNSSRDGSNSRDFSKAETLVKQRLYRVWTTARTLATAGSTAAQESNGTF